MKLVLCRILKDEEIWIISNDRSPLGKLRLNFKWDMSEQRRKEFLSIICGVTDWPFILIRHFQFLKVDDDGFSIYTGELMEWSMAKENLL